MRDHGGYGQFCPVAMASEIVCTRWTALILRELLSGSSRFNDIRRGVPLMSPTLLSKRLADLEQAQIITHDEDGAYTLTPAGEDLREVVMALGSWGQRWIESNLSLKNLDPSLLMWDMRRGIKAEVFPPRRTTVQFRYPELREGQQDWWLVAENGSIDLCYVDPGHPVDLLVTASLRTVTAVWMGLVSVAQARNSGELQLDGERSLVDSVGVWLGLSPFAGMERRAS